MDRIERRVELIESALGKGPGPGFNEKGEGLLGAFSEVVDAVQAMRADAAADRAARALAELNRRAWWATAFKVTGLVLAIGSASVAGVLWLLAHVKL